MSALHDTRTPQRRGARRSLMPLWALIAIIGLPLLAALVLNFQRDWLPQARSNRGELITPPQPLAGRQLQQAGGGELALDALQGRWVMVAVADPACGEACRRRAYELRQVRLATGAERERVARIMAFGAPPDTAALAGLRADYPQLALALDSAPAAGAAVLPAAAAGSVYLIDPMGNLMMRYAPGAPADDILKDLKHLLRLSKEWQ